MAVGDAHVFPSFLAPALTQVSFQSHRLLFSHASEVRGENTDWLGQNVIFINPFPNNSGFAYLQKKSFENTVEKGQIACNENFSFSHSVFYPF